MIKQIVFADNYDEKKVRATLGVIAKFPNAGPQEIVVKFSAVPSMTFTLTGVDAEQFIAQANRLKQELTGDQS